MRYLDDSRHDHPLLSAGSDYLTWTLDGSRKPRLQRQSGQNLMTIPLFQTRTLYSIVDANTSTAARGRVGEIALCNKPLADTPIRSDKDLEGGGSPSSNLDGGL